MSSDTTIKADGVVVTLEEMKIAIHEALKDKRNFSLEDSSKLADYIMGFFGFDDSIIDNVLTSKDRDRFYMLQEVGILTTMEDEASIKKGKTWRIYYWVLNKPQIHLLVEHNKAGPESKEKRSIYESMADDVWADHRKHDQE